MTTHLRLSRAAGVQRISVHWSTDSSNVFWLHHLQARRRTSLSLMSRLEMFKELSNNEIEIRHLSLSDFLPPGLPTLPWSSAAFNEFTVIRSSSRPVPPSLEHGVRTPRASNDIATVHSSFGQFLLVWDERADPRASNDVMTIHSSLRSIPPDLGRACGPRGVQRYHGHFNPDWDMTKDDSA